MDQLMQVFSAAAAHTNACDTHAMITLSLVYLNGQGDLLPAPHAAGTAAPECVRYELTDKADSTAKCFFETNREGCCVWR